ncbi:hypothetical protein HDE_13896 [Halotydeus destructor]|nr:hypothetical protein HDE_13896 [Halotydeus destructor]
MVISRITQIASGNSDAGMAGKPLEAEDCLECRLVGGTGLSCLGLYVLYQTRSHAKECQQQLKQTSKGRLIMASLLGISLIGLGVVRFSGITLPFTEEKHPEIKSKWT